MAQLQFVSSKRHTTRRLSLASRMSERLFDGGVARYAALVAKSLSLLFHINGPSPVARCPVVWGEKSMPDWGLRKNEYRSQMS